MEKDMKTLDQWMIDPEGLSGRFAVAFASWKVSGPKNEPPVAEDAEYKKFARMDLSNM